jgi:uncharacterized protein YwgA
MQKKELKAKDLLLTLLYLPGVSSDYNEPIAGRTRLTKMFFLFEKEIYKNFDNFKITNMPEFFAYKYGPFSKDLLDDIRFFCNIGFINEEPLEEDMTEPEIHEYCFDIIDDIGYGEEDVNTCNFGSKKEMRYSLTKKGEKYVKENLIDKFSEEQKDLLSKFKQKINELPLDAILEYVYNKYPESAEKSNIKEKYLIK